MTDDRRPIAVDRLRFSSLAPPARFQVGPTGVSPLFSLAVLLALFAVAPSSGTGPAPSPSLRIASDTIYALAVDSAKYPRESYVYLLDDGVLRYEADGRGSRTYRQVIQILKEDAVERWAEFQFSYEPRHERLTVNWARVVKPDGTVVSDKPGPVD